MQQDHSGNGVGCGGSVTANNALVARIREELRLGSGGGVSAAELMSPPDARRLDVELSPDDYRSPSPVRRRYCLRIVLAYLF